MNTINTNELTGAALDWAVAKSEGYTGTALESRTGEWYIPSNDWSQGGPIIEREKIATRENADSHDWYACKRWDNHGTFGPTPLIAAMRCYVASKLGDTVQVPAELA